MADTYTFTFEDKWWKKYKAQYDEIYSRAAKETQAKFDAYMAQYREQDEAKKRELAAGKITQAQYGAWLTGKIEGGQRWKDMQSVILKDIDTTNRKALAVALGYIPNAFVGGYNEVGIQAPLKGYSFNLVDSSTVLKLMTANKSMLPKIEIDGKKQDRWNRKLLHGEIMQGVLQGESIPKIAKRLENVFGKNERGWLNNARTAMTAAENLGRQASYEQMEEDGIEMGKRWIATHDRRVRKSHQHIDGEVVKIKEEFGNGLMYPGDPDGDPEEVYGCRCTMVAEVLGFRKLKYSQKRADREEKMAVGQKIYDAQDEMKAFESQMKSDGNWEYDGIWKDPVTLADYDAKKGSIDAKMAYFQSRLDYLDSHGKGFPDPEYLKFDELMHRLDDFKMNGEEYMRLKDDYNGWLQRMAGIDKVGGAPVGSPFSPDAYTQARKDNALWFTSKNGGKPAADKVFRPVTSKAWSEASLEEKKWTYEYTMSYHKYNEPLRGIVYGQSKYVGVGKVDFDDIGVSYGGFQRGQIRKQIGNITDMINRSPLPQDAWFNRGCGYSGMDKFLSCDMDLLKYGKESELKKELLGKSVTEYGFMSTSSMKGDGFSGNVMLNIYAPKGTKALYVEPFSAFGGGASGTSWDGKSGQSYFGGEFETIFQQGTEMRITKVERDSSGKIWIDLDVIGQGKEQR